jgi:hypothetical protein
MADGSAIEWPDWRQALRNAPTDVPAAREAIITGTFSDSLKQIGGYRYAPSLRIRRPGHERTLYHLVYGTRSPAGLAVFRESEIKALEGEAVVQSELKRGKREEKTGQGGLFPAEMEAGFDPATKFMNHEKRAARQAVKDLLSHCPQGAVWLELWPKLLERHAVNLSSLGREINALRKAGEVEIPAWPSEKKQLPEDEYLIRLPQ